MKKHSLSLLTLDNRVQQLFLVLGLGYGIRYDDVMMLSRGHTFAHSANVFI